MKHYLRTTYASYNHAFEEFEYSYTYDAFDSYEDAVDGKKKIIDKQKQYERCFEYKPQYDIIDHGDILCEEMECFKSMELRQFMELIK